MRNINILIEVLVLSSRPQEMRRLLCWSWGWSWSWSLIGHHGVRCVREGVVRGIVVAKVSVVSVLWLIVRLVVLVARVAGVARVARVEEASPDLLSTGGRQQAAHHNLQGDGPD